jgi:flagellar hook-basal body complex protein FliE
MVNRIGSTGAAPLTESPQPTRMGDGGGGFSEAFDRAVQSVDNSQKVADEKLMGVADGSNTDLHTSMISLEQANIALRTMASTRDKIIEAYQQIWNMPI